jgi:hypothetical protein
MHEQQNELSDDQIARQDAVDNLIFELIQSINTSTIETPWDIEMIGDIRNCVKEWIVNRYELCDEQSFYPYIKE